jgi:hypothetical protein
MIETSSNTSHKDNIKLQNHLKSPKNSNNSKLNLIKPKKLTSCHIDSNIIESKELEHEILVKNSKILNKRQEEIKKKYLEKSNKFYNEYDFGIPKYNQFKPKYSLRKIEEFLDEKIEEKFEFFPKKKKLEKINKKKFNSFGENILSPKTTIFNLTKLNTKSPNKIINENRLSMKDSNDNLNTLKNKEAKKQTNSQGDLFSEDNVKNKIYGSLTKKNLRIKLNDLDIEPSDGDNIIENDKEMISMNNNTSVNYNKIYSNEGNNNYQKDLKRPKTLKINNNKQENNNLPPLMVQGNNSMYSCYNNIFNMTNKNNTNLTVKGNSSVYSKNNRITFRSTDAITNRNITNNKYFQTYSNKNKNFSDTNFSNTYIKILKKYLIIYR